jgi:hypothetical protein
MAKENPMSENLCERSKKNSYISRRKFWMEAGMGIGGLALLDLLNQDRLLGAECAATPGAKLDSPARKQHAQKAMLLTPLQYQGLGFLSQAIRVALPGEIL